MDKIVSALYFLAVLSALVLAHEWGHYIVAKLCGMRVDDFSLFFGKVIIPLGERNGTKYNIRLIPLGGFVKIAGMEPEDISNGAPLLTRNPKKRHLAQNLQGLDMEALDTIDPEQISERVEQAVDNAVEDNKVTPNGEAELIALSHSATINAQEQRYIETVLASKNFVPDPTWYNQKPLWQRAAVIFAGPVMSLFLGYFLFCAMGMTNGLPRTDYNENVIESVVRGKPADKVGLKSGDRIVQINDTKITDGEQMVSVIHDHAGVPLRLVIARGNAPLQTLTATPDSVDVEEDKSSGKPAMKQGQLGFVPRPHVIWQRYGPVEAIKTGTIMIYNYVRTTLIILTHPKLAAGNVGGIVSIAGQIHQDSKEGPWRVIFTAAMLSISLGIMNLLPIPVLDGGHLLLLSIEGIRRRKLTGREVYGAQLVGISIIGVLFVLVMYKDISGLLHR